MTALVAGALMAFAVPVLAGEAAPASMFDVYAQNRERQIPNYVTEDFLLVSYALLVADSSAEAAEAHSSPELSRLVGGLLDKVRRSEGDAAVRRGNVEFLSVLAALLEEKSAPPGALPAVVQEEVDRVRAAGELAFSKVALQPLDYGQFRPRGDYTRSETLKRYFRALRYGGAVLFPLKESAATGISAGDADRLTRQAVLLSALIKADPELAAAHAALEGRFEWLFGPAEDLTVDDYAPLVADGRPIATLRAETFRAARKAGRRPAILSAPVAVERLEPGVEARDVLTGWRLFPQRVTPDSAALQQLVYASVGAHRGEGTPSTLSLIDGKPVKGFPLGLELAALLGSSASAQRLDAAGERNYEGYDDAFARAKQALFNGRGRAAGEVALMSYWARQKGPDAAADARRVDTILGFWTWQRHTSVLHAKQSYTAGARSLGPPPRKSAWLEPAPDLYQRLADVTREAAQRLDSPKLASLAPLLDRCVGIARREASGGSPSAEDVAFLNRLDAELSALVSRGDRPIVVDVHTEPTSRLVLEEALGFPKLVEKALPDKVKARGALFNHLEFKQPMDHRLDDEAWLARLQSGAAGQETIQ